jgi:hypothetical protein
MVGFASLNPPYLVTSASLTSCPALCRASRYDRHRAATANEMDRTKPGHDGRVRSCYKRTMTAEDIEKAIAKLPADQLAQFRVWFEEFDSVRFDQQIARDAASGKLDRLAEQALVDFRKDQAREL